MKRKLIGFFVLLTLTLRAADTNWIPTFITNSINKVSATNQIESLRYYDSYGSAYVSVYDIKYGDKVMVLISLINVKEPVTNKNYSVNVVGYMNLDIPNKPGKVNGLKY
jgi:hypothetical protein